MTKEKLAISKTILEHLGGRLFIACTQAKDFLPHCDGISFSLPSREARDGINYVRITQQPGSFTAEYGRRKGMTYEHIATDECPPAMLPASFRNRTGMDTNR